jgi:putative transposase
VSYVGYQRYFLTSCTASRRRAFEDRKLAESCIFQLRHSARRHDFALAAYCFMPDHFHALVYGTSLQADLRAFVSHFKKLTGFSYRRQAGRALWQIGYHDRILRDEETTETVARYILGNPLRAGLTMRWGEYPFAGSDLYDYKQP